jgi:predicted HicB family RNase H-like nuclease
MPRIFKHKAKRVIYQGTRRAAFNTETAAEIGGSSDCCLFKTRLDGAYFLAKDIFAPDGVYSKGENIGIQPLTSEQAKVWLRANASPKCYTEEFDSSCWESGSEGRFTLRLPGSLKSKIDAIAKSEKLSLNAWVRKQLEEACEDGE